MATSGNIMKRIWVSRHGERLDMVDGSWVGKAQFKDDPPLADRGRVQASELAKRLSEEPIDSVFASPFQRCVETAHFVASSIGKSVNVEPGICEVFTHCNYPPGYMSIQDLKAKFSTVNLDYQHCAKTYRMEGHGDESCDSECFQRVGKTVGKILERFPNSEILLVGHGASCSGMFHYLTGRMAYVGLCTLSEFHPLDKGGKKWKAISTGDATHLSDRTNLRQF